MSSQIALICFLLILLLYSCRLEWKRPNRRFIRIRICCTIIVFGSIYLLAYPPTWKSPVRKAANKAIILTPGFDADSLRKLEKQPIFTMIRGGSAKPENLITDLSLFLKEHPGLNDLTILGRGLKASELPKLDHVRVRYIPGSKAGGMEHITWTRNIRQGESFRISGKYLNQSGRAVKLSLEAFGITADSTIIREDSLSTFTLKHLPSHLGRANYQLISTSGTDTLRREPLPFQVRERKKLDVMLLSSSPGFEYRFIKDWLKDTGQEVRARTRTSLGKFNSESTEGSGAADLTGSTRMNKADLLILDAQEFTNLSQAERNRIYAAVRGGLGLIVHGGPAKLTAPFDDRMFQRRPYPPALKDIVIDIDGTLVSKPIDQSSGSNHLLQTPETMPLLTDRSRRILAALTRIGKGALVVSTLDETYPIRLRGEVEKYGKLWTTLIDQTSRMDRSDLEVFAEEDFPVAGQPANWLIRHKGGLEGFRFGGAQIKPSQDPLLRNIWSAGLWSSSAGWKEIKGSDSTAVYLYQADDWSDLRIKRSIGINKAYFNNRASAVHEPEALLVMEEQRVPVVVFYLLIILCCGFLWLEPKLL